jgi:hypothetical protein
MNKLEQMQYIILTPIDSIEWSLITESFSEQERQGIIVQKFYNGSMFAILDEL